MADPYKGGVALGEILFGKADPRAGLAEQGQVYRNADALEKARVSRAKRIAYEALPDAIQADPELSKRQAINLALLTINPNLSILAEGNLKLGDLAVQGQRADAIAAGNVPQYNQLTALQTDKPYQPIKVEGGMLRPDGVALGDEAFSVMPTPEALARIEATEARTRQGQQRTDAAVDNKRRPAQGGGGGKARSDDIVAQARERIAAGASAKKVAEYLISKGYPQEAKKIYSGK